MSLEPFCETDRQRELARLIDGGMAVRKAARELGIVERNAYYLLSRIKRRASLRGYSPEHGWNQSTPPTHLARGVSTLYNADGAVSQQWVKADVSRDAQVQAMREAFADIAENFKGTAKPVKAPARSVDNMLTVYPLGDPHVGMYAFWRECGEDFNADIARADLLAATSRLVDLAPPSERAIVGNLGDYYHAEGTSNTTTSGTRQDVDTRWGRVLRVGWMLMVDLINLALKKHQIVEVVNVPGNHDDHMARVLAAIMEAWFHNEPRVIVHRNDSLFHYLEFGKVLLGFVHGDKIKAMDLGEVMAADQPEAWGRTMYRHWLTGHVHHTSKREMRGCTQESFRTLAAKDAWHTGMGYRSGRDMCAIVYDKEYGEVERYRCDIRMARAAA